MKKIIFALACLAALQLRAQSPFATTTTGVPLNQLTNDSLNGILATSTQPPLQGSLVSLTDATSASSPTNFVIVGPDDGPSVQLRWDLGNAVAAGSRHLDLFSIWFSDDPDRERVGFDGSLATSIDGITFTTIANTSYSTAFPASPGLFHNIIYNFSGTNVDNFRFLQLTSTPYIFPTPPGNPALQPRFVEADAIIRVPEPSTLTLLLGGAGCVGFSFYRKSRRPSRFSTSE